MPCFYEVDAHFRSLLHNVVAYSAGEVGIRSHLKRIRDIPFSVTADEGNGVHRIIRIGDNELFNSQRGFNTGSEFLHTCLALEVTYPAEAIVTKRLDIVEPYQPCEAIVDAALDLVCPRVERKH